MRKDLAYVALTERIIGCAIAVHKVLGPGFLEKIYEQAFCFELDRLGISFERQVNVPISYRGRVCGMHRLDLVIDKTVVVELKAVKSFEDIHFATVLSYLKASNLRVALLLNFAEPTVAIRRFGNKIINGELRKSGGWEELSKFLRNGEKVDDLQTE